jgi:two-component system phosphate regulon sensor histidine kinase PhoR
VEFFWFLIGLSIGLALLAVGHAVFQHRLKQLANRLKAYSRESSTETLASDHLELLQAVVTQEETLVRLERDLGSWRQICQLAPFGVLQVDEDNQLVWANLRACELLGVQSQTTRPRLLLELVRSYELDHLIELTRNAGKPCQSEWTFRPVSSDASQLSQQQSRRLRASGFPLHDGWIGVFLEDRQETVQLMRQRDRWIADVAHELKTPLTSIRLVAETLQSRLEPPQRQWLDRLLQETIRLSNVVQDLLDLNQLQAQSTRLNLKSVDLPGLIQLAWSCLEPLARRKHLQLDYVGPSHLLIQADESRMQRVLLNLLDNSIQYSPLRQCIRVQVTVQSPETSPDKQSDKQQVCLEIIDAGSGFPENALPYVFDRLYRADPSRTRPEKSAHFINDEAGSDRNLLHGVQAEEPIEKSTLISTGSGLGLAIVRQIVEAHQGTVKASNHPDTQGAWIQVFLPYQES